MSLNPTTRLPILAKLEDHFEWKTEHLLYFKSNDLDCILIYDTEDDFFDDNRIADSEQNRYYKKLDMLIQSNMDPNDREAEIDKLNSVFQSSLTIWSRERAKSVKRWREKQLKVFAHLTSHIDKDSIRPKVLFADDDGYLLQTSRNFFTDIPVGRHRHPYKFLQTSSGYDLLSC
jgi:hypothetical protein